MCASGCGFGVHHAVRVSHLFRIKMIFLEVSWRTRDFGQLNDIPLGIHQSCDSWGSGAYNQSHSLDERA